MKKVEVISEGANYSAVNVGSIDTLREHKLPMGPGVEVAGKVFVGSALKATGAEMSFQTFAPGEGSPFFHAHKTHEELYIIIKGNGEFEVDGKTFPITEGSIVRVATAGMRALRNTGSTDMVMICIQYKESSFAADDSPMNDGIISDKPMK